MEFSADTDYTNELQMMYDMFTGRNMLTTVRQIWHPQTVYLTHCGRVTQICVFTLQLCKTDDANLRF